MEGNKSHPLLETILIFSGLFGAASVSSTIAYHQSSIKSMQDISIQGEPCVIIKTNGGRIDSYKRLNDGQYEKLEGI